MSESEKRILENLAKHIDDLVLHSHSSKNREVSDLFSSIDKKVDKIDKIDKKVDKLVISDENLTASVNKLQTSYEEEILPNVKSWNDITETYENEILPNIKTWNETSDTYKDDKKWLVRLIGGILVTAVLALILAKNVAI